MPEPESKLRDSASYETQIKALHQVNERLREDAADLLLIGLGFVTPDATHEPDESFCATIYAAVDGDQDARAELAAIGRSQRAADSELTYAIQGNLHRLKKLTELLAKEPRRPGPGSGYLVDLASSAWLALDQAHRDYHEMRQTDAVG